MAIKVECEWDLGVGLISSWDNKEQAEEFFKKAVKDYEDDIQYTYEEAIQDGMITYSE